MKLSVKSEYAYPALIELSAIYQTDQLRENAEITENKDIPQKYLEPTPLVLKRRGNIKSYKDFIGGYKLAKTCNSMNVAEIIRLMGEALVCLESVGTCFYQHTPIEKSPNPLDVLRGIGNDNSDKPGSLSFANIIE
jgi:Rrf2 family protein